MYCLHLLFIYPFGFDSWTYGIMYYNFSFHHFLVQWSKVRFSSECIQFIILTFQIFLAEYIVHESDRFVDTLLLLRCILLPYRILHCSVFDQKDWMGIWIEIIETAKYRWQKIVSKTTWKYSTNDEATRNSTHEMSQIGRQIWVQFQNFCANVFCPFCHSVLDHLLAVLKEIKLFNCIT